MGLAIIIMVLMLYAGGAAGQSVTTPDTTELRTIEPLLENWRFVQDDTLSDDEALASTGADWAPVRLPHTWNAQDAASLNAEDYKRGLGWYRLEFATPMTGARHWLEFGAASLVADVWLNGQKRGQHRGGFTAFRFDVTNLLTGGFVPQRPNVLLVKTDNSIPQEDDDVKAIDPLGGDFNKSGGLYRHVALISTADPLHFALDDLGGPGVYATTTALGGGAATVNVRSKLTNASTQDSDVIVRVALLDADGRLAGSSEQPVMLLAGGTQEVSQDVSVGAPHLWQGVADPYQYQLVAELVRPDGVPLDRVVQRFGIRQIRFDPNAGFFLNGEPLRLHGVAMHQDFLGKAWAVSNDDIDTSLALIREVGANAVRLGHYPFSQYTLERLSELGLIAWAEKPNGLRTTVESCSTTDPTDAYLANARQQLQELIRQQFNHAAIALWSIGNETEAGQSGCDKPFDNVTPVLRELNALAKSEDPGRLTALAEFTQGIERSTGIFGDVAFTTAGISDVLGTNRYYLWYALEFDEFGPLLDVIHRRFPSQPLSLSEYGAGSALTHHTDNPQGGPPEVRSAPDDEVSFQPEEYAAYVHEQNYRVILSRPYLWGSFVWNMFDFGSAHRNEGDVLGVNTKGLVSFDRRTRKDPFFFYKANWSAEPVMHIVGRRYTDRAYPVTNIKVYSNADSVQLSVNGTPIGTLTADQCELRTCVFENVPLSPGLNTVMATGTHAGTPVSDTVDWTLNIRDIAIAAGRLTTGYISSQGTRFGSDDFFAGGSGTYIEVGEDARGGIPDDINGTDDPLLYKYFRRGDFSYAIPLADGRYDLTLGFFEPEFDPERTAATGDRVFSVIANGQTLLEGLDVLQAAGGARTVFTRTFPVDVTGGRLVINFNPVQGEAIVSTIKTVRQQ